MPTRAALPAKASALFVLAAASACRTGPKAAPAPPPPPRISQAVLLDGRPFPRRPGFSVEPPPALRTFHVSGNAGPGGDGSAERPWRDLAAALHALSSGDRLIVGEGEYTEVVRVDQSCRDGTAKAPITVIFEKAEIHPSNGAVVLSVSRSFWRFERLTLDLGDRDARGFVVEGPARGVVFDRARIAGGAGTAVRVGAGATATTISRSSFVRGSGAVSPGGLAIAVESGSSDTRIVENAALGRPSGAVRVGPPSGAFSGGPAPRAVVIEGNTFSGSRAPAVLVTEGTEVRIAANTILCDRRGLEGRGIVVEGGSAVRLEGNHVVDASVSVQVGWREPGGTGSGRPEDVLVSRNYFERRAAEDTTGVDVEAGRDVRIANNVFEELSEALALFGAPPQTVDLVIANNLVLGATRLAFRADGLAGVAFFTANVFGFHGPAVPAEMDGKPRDLRRLFSSRPLRGNRIVSGVAILRKDLGHIEGVETRDAGVPVRGVAFEGAAPDLGLAER
ncbi:MAG: right-handed parallel beta-helix repeat-containing protein [Acidobacteriota bacterium]|nr:right-handed parallel beta-helix repeat-containing protein [Acidobacteriota bacterium]